MASKSPTLLTNVQRARLTHIPTDMTDREIGQYDTFTPSDLTIIRRHRGPQNWLGFAVQLAVLRFPGRPLTDLDSIPTRVLAYLAQQVGVAPDVLSDYGTRPATLSDHLDEIRSTFGYRDYDWRAIRWLMNHLVPMAMHGTRPLPLIEAALHLLRTQMVIAPAIRSLERVVWRSLRLVERRAYRVLSRSLSGEQQTALDGMLTSAPSPGRARGSTRLTWLRKAPGNPSANQIQEIVARLTVLDTLNLPPFPSQIPRPQGLRLARQGATYQPQALAAFPPEKRYALLYAHLWDLQAERGDQAVDMFDAVLTELMRKGEHHQQTHITTHGRAMNTHLRLLAQILEVFRTAQQAGRDPAVAVLSILPEAAMDEVLEDLRHLLRPDDFDYLDLIETRYVKLRSSLFAFYRTMTFHPLHHRDPALDALNHVQTLAQHRQRVTAIKQTIGDQTYLAPLDHLRERWRRHALTNETIHPNDYEAAAFDQLKAALRSGDMAVAPGRRYGTLESYLLPKAVWESMQQRGDTGLALTCSAEEYLEQQQQQIHTSLRALQWEMEHGNGLTVDAHGDWHLERLTAETPREANVLSRQAYRLLPRIDLCNLVQEVAGWTHMLDDCPHLITGDILSGDLAQRLLLVLMAQGMNIGLDKMAQASSTSYHQLAWVEQWFLRDETLSQMLITLNNFIARQELTRLWGDGTQSSSDGLRVRLGVQSAQAAFHANHTDGERGATFYLQTMDFWSPHGHKVIKANDREALHVLDLLSYQGRTYGSCHRRQHGFVFIEHLIVCLSSLILASSPGS